MSSLLKNVLRTFVVFSLSPSHSHAHTHTHTRTHVEGLSPFWRDATIPSPLSLGRPEVFGFLFVFVLFKVSCWVES